MTIASISLPDIGPVDVQGCAQERRGHNPSCRVRNHDREVTPDHPLRRPSWQGSAGPSQSGRAVGPGPSQSGRAPRPGLRAAALVALVLLLVPASASAREAGRPPAQPAGPAAGDPAYVLPVPGAGAGAGLSRTELRASGWLVHDFDAPSERWGAGHRGVDLSAAPGAAVFAPRAGTVSFIGVVVDRPLMVLTHDDGRRSTLEPVTTDLAVGDRVQRGDPVAVLAPVPSSHCAPQWCLHWGVRRGDDYLDPLALARVVEAVVLLPLT